MADTPIQFESAEGETLTVELYPDGSDAIANGAGDTATESTNRKGTYTITVAEALTGLHQLKIKAGGVHVGTAWVWIVADDETTYFADTARSQVVAAMDIAAIASSAATLVSRTASAVQITFKNFQSDGVTLVLNQGEDYKAINGNPIDIDIIDDRLTSAITGDGTVPVLLLGRGSETPIEITGSIEAWDDSAKKASLRFEIPQATTAAMTAGVSAYRYDVDFRIEGVATRVVTSIIGAPCTVNLQVA